MKVIGRSKRNDGIFSLGWDIMKETIGILILYILRPFLSFVGGFYAYVLTLKLVWNQTLGGDKDFVLFYGALAFLIVAFPIYLGIIRLIDKIFSKWKILLYPLGCILVFFLPTLKILLIFGSANLFLPEAMLFYSFFITSGLIFGLSTWIINNII